MRVLLAHGDEPTCRSLKEALNELGHEVAGVCNSTQALVEQCAADPPELIVTGVHLSDGDGIAALIEISKTVAIPAIIVTPKASLHLVERAIKDHVMAWLSEPIRKEDVKPTVHLVAERFAEFQELRSEVESLKQALADRKVIERAKGCLMRRADIGEEEAYKRLRRMATDGRIKLIEAARQVLAVEDMLSPSTTDPAA